MVVTETPDYWRDEELQEREKRADQPAKKHNVESVVCWESNEHLVRVEDVLCGKVEGLRMLGGVVVSQDSGQKRKNQRECQQIEQQSKNNHILRLHFAVTAGQTGYCLLLTNRVIHNEI